MDRKPSQPEPIDPADKLPALSRGLKDVYGHNTRASANIDEVIRAETRQHFARAARSTRVRWRTMSWATAAVILVSLTSWLIWPGFQRVNQPGPIAVQWKRGDGDIDRNGRVDILDAFAIARYIEQGGTTPRPDVNGDGMVDDADVNVVALQAVQLDAISTPKGVSS